jgi:hypothetical protein
LGSKASYVAFEFDTQIMLVLSVKPIVMEGVPTNYRMNNSESRLMKNSKGITLHGKQVWHREIHSVHKIPRFGSVSAASGKITGAPAWTHSSVQ